MPKMQYVQYILESFFKKTFFLHFFGFLWILKLLYFRLILSFIFVEVYLYENNFSYVSFFFLVFFTFINFCRLFFIVLNFFGILKNIKLSKFKKNVDTIINIFYWYPLEHLYKKIENKVPGSGNFFFFLEKYVSYLRDSSSYNNILYRRSLILLVFLFDVMPKLVIALVFFVDIIFFARIKYFFVIMPLFFLPIILKVFLKLVNSCGVENMITIKEYFVYIKPRGPAHLSENGAFYYYDFYACKLKPEYANIDNPQEQVITLVRLQNLCRHVWVLNNYLKKFTPYTLFFTVLLYFISGLIRIFIIIF